MSDGTILRVAVSQSILFTILCYLFVLLGFVLDKEDYHEYHFARNSLILLSAYLVIPVMFAIALIVGAMKKNLRIIKIWITASILNAIILLCLLMSGAIRLAREVDVFWAIIILVFPILLMMWVVDHVVIVSDAYKKLEIQQKQEAVRTAVKEGISIA